MLKDSLHLFENEEYKEFIHKHINDKTDTLALVYGKKNIPWLALALHQIASYQQVKEKWGFLAEVEKVYFPPKRALEQSSSIHTAQYKASTIPHGAKVLDLTTGSGIDFYFHSLRASAATFVEYSRELFEVTAYNLKNWGISCNGFCSTAEDFLKENTETWDLIYIDPDRRVNSKKSFRWEDCSPNIIEILDTLLDIGNEIHVKASPLLDISEAIRAFSKDCVQEVKILSVDQSCKELVFILKKDPISEKQLRLVHLHKNKPVEELLTTFELQNAKIEYRRYVLEKGGFIYEPNPSIMKANAWQSFHTLIDDGYKLHPHTHLWYSKKLLSNIPGRSYKVVDICPYKGKKSLLNETIGMDVSTRNFPIGAEELKRILGVKKAGRFSVMGCTLLTEEKVLLILERIL